MPFRRDKNGETAGEHAVEGEHAQAGDESTAVVEGGGEQSAEPATQVHAGAAPEGSEGVRHELGGPVGDELAQAGAEAGDSAAAGTGMEGAPPDRASAEAGALGTAAASPEQPAGAAEGYAGQGPSWGGSSYSDSAGDDEQSLGERIEAIAEERPEVAVGAAFAGGLVLARVLAALGGGR